MTGIDFVQKRGSTVDAEQIADLLRTSLVTQSRLHSHRYVALRRAWGEHVRLREERARLKGLVRHQLYGMFPELVRVWKNIFTPGALAVLRLGSTSPEIATMSFPEFGGWFKARSATAAPGVSSFSKFINAPLRQ